MDALGFEAAIADWKKTKSNAVEKLKSTKKMLKEEGPHGPEFLAYCMEKMGKYQKAIAECEDRIEKLKSIR